jgi:signal transduction histidine kinase
MTFVDVENIQDGLDKVEEGKLFGFIGTLATVGYNIQRDYIGQLKIIGKFDETWDLGIGSRNDEPLLNSIFNKAIDSISYEQRQSILNKWISVNYQRGFDYTFIAKVLVVLFILILISALLYRQSLLKKLNKQLNEKVKLEIEKNSHQNQILNQQAKMASMGEMIGNIAHQWRQPLSVISITATGLKFRKEFEEVSDEEITEALDSINNTSQFLSKTIDDFRTFFENNSIPIEITISNTVDKSLEIIGVQFVSKEINIVTNIEDIEIVTLENELIQVLINILNNAKDAFNNIETMKYIFIDAFSKDKELTIKIRDNAGGINKDIITKIFEPYFTTKHKSQGTGIGLYMSEKMITQHLQGSIKVENKEYIYHDENFKGAQFTIILSELLQDIEINTFE